MFIVYSGHSEVIVTTKKKEAQTLKEWFVESDRDIEDYDREECNDACVEVRAELRVY